MHGHWLLGHYIKYFTTNRCKIMQKGAPMKKKLLNLSKTLLTCCMAFSGWIASNQASILCFGEYPYPNPSDYEK